MKQKRGALWWRIPLLALAFCGILAFLLPMTMGIVNIGSVTILIFAVLIGLFATFFDGIARLLKRWWQKRAGKTVLSFLAAVACLAVLTAGVLSGFMAYAATRTPPDTAATARNAYSFSREKLMFPLVNSVLLPSSTPFCVERYEVRSMVAAGASPYTSR